MAPPLRPLRLLGVLLAAALLAPAGAAAADAPRQPIVIDARADLPSAAAAIERATGAKAEKLPFGDVPLAEGVSFAVPPRIAEQLLEGSHVPLRSAGLYLFRFERSYGMAGEKDRVGLVKGADHRAVIRRVGTGQAAKGLTSETVVAWLEALSKDEPFELWEVGTDYLAGRFTRTPKDPEAIARRCAEIAPELVAGRAATLELLAREIKSNRTLYLIW